MKKKDAFMTVEATLIFPIIFLSIMLLIFMGLVMYQQCSLFSLAARSASRGSIIYTTCSKNLDTGSLSYEDFKDRNPYRFIWDSEAKDKTNMINNYVKSHIGDNNAYTGLDKTGTYASRQGGMFKKIYVKINMDYNNPVKGIARMFGVQGIFKVDVYATAPVSEPVELIRNVDLVVDYLNRYAGGAMEKLSGIKDKLNECVDFLTLEEGDKDGD